MKPTIPIATSLLFALLLAVPLSGSAQNTAFTYQGCLNATAGPASGSYDFMFALYDSGTNGYVQGPVLTNTATMVKNGLFTVTLDFGNQYPGADRWLEIGVCTNGAGNFLTLAPRQHLTPSPYAITAGNVLPGGISAGTYTNAIIFSNPANQYYGNGGGITNLSAAQLTGAVPLGNLPAASATSGGYISTNAYVQAVAASYANDYYGAMPIYYQSWLSHGGTFNATQLTNLVQWVVTNSYLTSLGHPFIINVDEGWSATNRDAQGRIQGDTNKWPAGMATYASYCRQYGIGMILYSENDAITGAVKDIGSDGTNIEYDAQTMAAWGMIGCKFDLNDHNGTLTGSNLLMVLQRFENAFRGAAPNCPVYFISDVGLDPIDSSLWASSLPGTSFRFYCENVGTCTIGDLPGMLIRLDDAMTNHAAFNGKNTWVLPGELQDVQNDPNPLLGSWEGKVLAAGGYVLVAAGLNDVWPSLTTWTTNSEYLRVDLDSGRAAPWIVPGLNGSAPATWQCLARNLSDDGGGLVLCFFSRNQTTNYAASIKWTDLGYPPGTTFFVRDIWNQTSWGLCTNGLSLTISSNDATMLRVLPIDAALWAAMDSPASGSGAGNDVTNFPASQITGTVSLTNLPAASVSSGGYVSTNAYVQSVATPYANITYSGAMPIYYQTWLNHGSTFNATQLTNLVQWVVTNSYLTSLGHPFIINIDEGWSANTRDAQGRIQGDPVKWPAGMATYAGYCAQYGIGLILYSENNDRAAAVGDVASGRGTNIEYDAQTMAAWGMAGCKFDLFTQNGHLVDDSNLLMILQRFENAFRAAAPNRPAYFISDVGPYPMDSSLWAGSLSGTSVRFYCENVGTCTVGDLPGALIRLDDALTNHMAFIGPDNWVFPSEYQDNQSVGNPLLGPWEGKVFATAGFVLVIQALYEAWPSQTTWVTNEEFLRVDLDSGAHQPWIVHGRGDAGSWQCLARNLADDGGGLALCFFSRNQTNNYPAAVNWTDLGYPPSTALFVRDVWNQTNWGIYTNGLSLTINSNDATLLRLWPVNAGLYSALAATLAGTSTSSLVIRSNLAPLAVPGAVVLWNSNNVSQFSIRPGSTNFDFNY